MDESISRIHFEDWRGPEEIPAPRRGGRHMSTDVKTLWRKYAITIIGASVFTLFVVLFSYFRDMATERRVYEELGIHKGQKVIAVSEGQGKIPDELIVLQDGEELAVIQTPTLLTGEASLIEFWNAEVLAVTKVVAKLNTDEQKKTEVGIFIARHMNPSFPDNFQTLAMQKEQWPLYDGSNDSYDERDLQLVSDILIPYLRDGILPINLKSSFCWASWEPMDLIARNDYFASKATETWRYIG